MRNFLNPVITAGVASAVIVVSIWNFMGIRNEQIEQARLSADSAFTAVNGSADGSGGMSPS